MNRHLIFEQETSLVERLIAAGIEHGDTAELDLVGVGVRASQFGMPSMAFCPMSIANAVILQKGTRQERRLHIPALVQVSNNLRRRIFETGMQHGFISVRALIHSNGHIQLNGRVINAEPVSQELCVWGTDSYLNYQDLISAK